MRLEYLHPHRVYEAVDSGQADLGLVSYPEESTSLAAIPWRTEPMVLVCHPQHPLAEQSQRRARGACKANRSWRFKRASRFAKRSTARSALQRVSRSNVALEFDNIETIKRAIEIGAGVSLLPEPTFAREIAIGHAGQSSARRRAARAAAGHHPSPRPQAERNGPAIHPVAAIAGGAESQTVAVPTARTGGHRIERPQPIEPSRRTVECSVG